MLLCAIFLAYLWSYLKPKLDDRAKRSAPVVSVGLKLISVTIYIFKDPEAVRLARQRQQEESARKAEEMRKVIIHLNSTVSCSAVQRSREASQGSR
jgi:hypothetical protein